MFTPGARYPPAGLLLALPALAGTGLLECARDTYGRVRNGFYGLEVMLVLLVFLALLREPRAEGATRVPPAALGRVLGLDWAPEVKTIRRKLAGLAAAGKAADLIMALARHHAAARPAALGFLYADGHARAWFGNPTGAEDARGPAEVPRSGHRGDLGHRRRRRPGVHGYRRAVAVPGRATARPAPAAALGRGEGRRVTVCSGRGGWSPALFADITGAGSGLLTYRKSPVADLPGSAFTTITCTDDRGRSHEYELADTTISLEITEGPRKGEQVTLRQVSRREPASGGATRQVHTLTSRTDLPAGEVCWRMSSRWREENYFRYARTHSALDALDSYAAVPDDPDRLVPSPAKEAAAARVRRAEAATGAAEASRDASLLDLRSPAPGHAALLTNQQLNQLNAPVRAAYDELEAAEAAAAATPARVRLGDLAPDMVRLDAETKQITHAIRMAAYNAETILARALDGHYAPRPPRGTPSSARPWPPPATSTPAPASCSSGSTRSPPRGAPRRWPPLRPAQPRRIHLSRHRPHPALRGQAPIPALHDLLPHVQSPGAPARSDGQSARDQLTVKLPRSPPGHMRSRSSARPRGPPNSNRWGQQGKEAGTVSSTLA